MKSLDQKLEEIEDNFNYNIYNGLWRLRYDRQDYSAFIESDVKPLQAVILDYMNKSDTLDDDHKEKIAWHLLTLQLCDAPRICKGNGFTRLPAIASNRFLG